jgi:hypothetical protein
MRSAIRTTRLDRTRACTIPAITCGTVRGPSPRLRTPRRRSARRPRQAHRHAGVHEVFSSHRPTCGRSICLVVPPAASSNSGNGRNQKTPRGFGSPRSQRIRSRLFPMTPSNRVGCARRKPGIAKASLIEDVNVFACPGHGTGAVVQQPAFNGLLLNRSFNVA